VANGFDKAGLWQQQQQQQQPIYDD